MAGAAQSRRVAGTRKHSLVGWIPAGVAVLGVLIAAFLVLRPSDTPSMVGHAAPNFSVRSVTNTSVSLSALRGHPVVLNFWGVSCIYCRKEMPLLQEAYAAHRGDGLIIMGIDVQGDDVPSIDTFTSQRSVTYPQYLQGSVDWAGLYRVGALPESVFIDRTGIVRSFDPQPFLDAPSLTTALKTIL